MIYLVLCGLLTIPLLAAGFLLMIGLFSPKIRGKGLRQLSQPFRLHGGTVSEYALGKQRRGPEDEMIRRFGKPG